MEKMCIETIDDIYNNNELRFHWTRFKFVESILKKGILSQKKMKERGVAYPYAPDIAQQIYGLDMISVIIFHGAKTLRELYLEERWGCTYERPPRTRTLKRQLAFRNDVIFVISPEVKTIPLGWYPYEHLVKDIIDREYILTVCCDEENVGLQHEDKADDVISEIKELCTKYYKPFLLV
jgi:hypothetical protein